MPSDRPLRFKLTYMPCLDGMRACAVMAVMLHHSRAPFSAGGFIGVDIFFVLSGFLITQLLLTEYAKTGRISLAQFYIRRALRLLPALFLFLALMLLFSGMFGGFITTAIDAGLVLGYVANWSKALGFGRPVFMSHCWSLSIEEQFYLLWPTLFLGVLAFGRTPRRMVVMIGTLVAASLLERTLLFMAHADSWRLYTGLDTRADSLLIGCALAFLLAYYGVPNPGSRLGTLSAWGAHVAVVLLLLTMKFVLWRTPLVQTLGFTVIALLAATVVFYLTVHPTSWMRRLLELPLLVGIGRISYGLYLFHWPPIRWMNEHEMSRWTVMAIGFPLAFAIATLSYVYIERPALRLKERFRNAPAAFRPRDDWMKGAVSIDRET